MTRIATEPYVAANAVTPAASTAAIAVAANPPKQFEATTLDAYGHSFVAGTYVLPEARYPSRIARRCGMVAVNNGQDGGRAEPMSMLVASSTGVPKRYGVVTLDAMANNAYDTATLTIEGWKTSIRSCCASARAKQRHLNTDVAAVYNGTGWSQTSQSGFGNVAKTSVLNDYVEMPFIGDAITFDMVAYATAATQTSWGTPFAQGGNVEVKVDGVVVKTVSTLDRTQLYPYLVLAEELRGFGSGAHTMRLTNKTSGALLTFRGWAELRSDVPLVVIIKDYDFNAYPGLAALRAAADAIAAEFPSSVVTADCFTGVDSSMYASDGHPNHKGLSFYADKIIAAMVAAEPTFRNGLNLGVSPQLVSEQDPTP